MGEVCSALGWFKDLVFCAQASLKGTKKIISGSKAEAEDFWSNLGAIILISREF